MLELLKGELKKVEETLAKTKAGDYKRYATILQAYFTLANNVQQLEMVEERKRQEAKEEEERQRILKEAEEEIKKEEAQKAE